MEVINLKQTYLVHYKGKLTENKKSDLINVTVPEVETCPCCGIATSPTFIDGFLASHPDQERTVYSYIILYCPKCRNIYSARYFSHYGINDMILDNVFPRVANSKRFSDNILSLSPKFVSLYNQALAAESKDDMRGLSGLGYRKALEFLIKDYLIILHHQDKDTIIKMELSNCVNKLPDQLKDIAKASIWIGNDETHYFRKNPEYDIDDLKEFINCLIHFIEIEFTLAKVKNLTMK